MLTVALLTSAGAAASPDGLYMQPLDVSPDDPKENQKVNVEAVAYGPFSLSYMEFYVNGERKEKAICADSISFSSPFLSLPYGCGSNFEFTPYVDGAFDLKVKALSPLGSSTRTAKIDVESDGEVDNPAPKVNSIEFSPAQPVPGEEVSINVLASDISNTGLLGIESISASANGEHIGSKVCGVFDTTCEKQFEFAPSASGEVDVEITAIGADGQSTSRSKTLYVREELSSSGVTGTVSNPVTLYVETTDGIDASEYECYWDDDDSVSESDSELDRDGNRFEAEEEFEGGDQEVYMSCFRDGSSTNTVSTSFSIEENEEPEASLNINPENAETGEEIEFDASNSEDSDGEINRYRWDFDNDGSYDRTTDEDTTEKSFSNEFDGKAKVEVRDEDDATDTDTESYTVETESCDIKVSDLKLSGESVSSSDEVDVWLNISNEGTDSQEITTGFAEDGKEFYNKTRTIGEDKSYNFSTKLEASETVDIKSEAVTSGEPCGKKKFTDSIELQVEVEGLKADFEYEPDNPEVDERVEFDASDTASENDIESYRWEFDDGDSKLGEQVRHRFDEEDDYRVELEVEDDEGNTDRKRRTVEVGDSTDSGDGELRVNVEDEEGEELQDSRVRVSNGDYESERTDDDGEASFNLEKDEYEVEVSKDGYRTRTKTVEIQDGERETLDFELRREEDSELTVEVTDGYSTLDNVRVEVNRDVKYTDRGRAEFELGEGDYTVEASRDGFRTVSKFVRIEDGDYRTLRIELEEIAEKERKSIRVQLQSSRASYGDSVMVKGFVDNGNGRSNVKITRKDEELATVSTQPDGYFQAFVTPKRVGNYNIEVSTGSASSSTPLEVQPTASVSSITTPRKVFKGSDFDICATISSQVSASVSLSRNGDHVDTNMRRGRTCFDVTAGEAGETTYQVTAEVEGDKDTSSREIKVLELDEEVESFPGNIAAVETESGIIKVDLYNTGEELKRYSLDISGIDDSWVSQSSEQVILNKGERETAYFYLTGREEGTFNPTVSVSSAGTTVFSEQVRVEIGGTKTPRKRGWIEQLGDLLPF